MATFHTELLLQGKSATGFAVPDEVVASLGAGKRVAVVDLERDEAEGGAPRPSGSLSRESSDSLVAAEVVLCTTQAVRFSLLLCWYRA